jgi:quercetin dioxygenase-like cupin family protein
MRSRMAVGSAALLALIVVGVVWAAATEKKAPAHKASAAATAWSADDIKWEPVPGVEGAQMAMLWGDMKKGAYGALVKLPPNQDHPLHTHSAMVKAVVLAGEFRYTPEGGEMKSLGPGSYLMLPAKLRHSSASGPDGVTMFQESPGAWDMMPVAAPAASATSK